MEKIKKISDFNLSSKKVLVRLDLNVPFKNGKISDHTRIASSLPTLKEILKKKGIPVIISHFGRPKGKKNNNFSLKKIVSSLSKHLKKKVIFSKDCIGLEVKKVLENIKKDEIVLLENLRFHSGENSNNYNFAKKLTKYCDIYINDAFSASHRKHASIDKVAKLLPSGMGKNMEKEIINLNKFLKKPKKPLTAIIGGAKMENKINLINSLLKKCKFLILGGGVANTFLKSNKFNIGKSIYEKKQLKNVIKIQKKAKKNSCKIILPTDLIVSGKPKLVDYFNVNKNHQILDLGNKSLFVISDIINKSKTVIWSGPLGYFEKKPYDAATNKIASLINSKKSLISVAGGGDTIAAIKKNKKYKNFNYLSTGGGAFLHWLEKFTLPGIEALKK
jgi:phosphoglycerate kinase